MGELQGTESARWQGHLDSCSRCQATLKEMKLAGAHYMRSSSAAQLREQLRAGPTPFWRRLLSRQWVMIAAPAMALAVVALAVWAPPPDDLTPKGNASMALMVQRAGQAARAWDGKPLQPGDAAQVLWTSPRAGFLALVARGADGKTTTLMEPTKVAASSGAPVGPSLRIDSPEDVYEVLALFDTAPFSLEKDSLSHFKGELVRLNVTR
jgi:hypothetical protein